MAEFALVAPWFFLLLLGIIEGGRFAFYYHALNNATRDGARYAIVHGSNAADGCPSGPPPPSCDLNGDRVREAVRKAAFGLVAVGQFEALNVYWCRTSDVEACIATPGDNRRGSIVIVQARYSYKPLLPLFPSIGMEAESTLVINN